MIMLGTMFLILVLCNCRKCMKDYKHIQELLSSDLPQNNVENNTLTPNYIRNISFYSNKLKSFDHIYLILMI